MKKLIWLALLITPWQLLIAQAITDTLKVAYTPAPPFIIAEGESLEGVNIWLWKQIAKELGIVYEMKAMNFSDMLKAIETDSIDISINPLTITSERSKKMNFTHSYYASNSTVVVYESSYSQKIMQTLRSIFNLNFLRGFFALLFLIFLFGIGIWFFEKRENPEQFRPSWKGLWDGLWWSVVTMTTVGYGDKSPKSRGGKMIALIWMFSGLLFISGLTASVASMLTVNELKANYESFNEFKESAVGCIKNSSTNEFLEESFFHNIQVYESVARGLDDLRDNKIEAFLYDEPILKYRLNQDISYQDLRILPMQFDLQFYAFGLPKNKQALEAIISQKILEITESMRWRMILKEYQLSEI